jgi:phage gp36-like protein
MSYAQPDALRARLAPAPLAALADDDGDGLADEIILTHALAAASATIDQHLAARYVTPIADPSPVLELWCLDLALESLHARHGADLPKPIAESAALTRRALTAIHDGLANLAGAAPLPQDLLVDSTTLDDDPRFNFDILLPY